MSRSLSLVVCGSFKVNYLVARPGRRTMRRRLWCAKKSSQLCCLLTGVRCNKLLAVPGAMLTGKLCRAKTSIKVIKLAVNLNRRFVPRLLLFRRNCLQQRESLRQSVSKIRAAVRWLVASLCVLTFSGRSSGTSSKLKVFLFRQLKCLTSNSPDRFSGVFSPLSSSATASFRWKSGGTLLTPFKWFIPHSPPSLPLIFEEEKIV